MNNILSGINLTYSQLNKGITYPDELLVKFGLDSFDQENLSYIKNLPTKDGTISGGYYHYLTLLVKNTNAKLILELGNRYGVSTIALYHGLNEGQKLISLDMIKDQRYVPDKIINDSRVKFIIGDCLDLSCYPRDGADIPIDIDIFWTDTVHYYGQVKAEFQVYEPLLSDEALIVIDDIRLNDKGKFFSELSYEKYDLSDVCHSSGFGVIHYIRPMDQRGLSAEKRLNIAMERAVGIMASRYWDLYNEYEECKANYKASHLSSKFRKALKPAYYALRKLLINNGHS